MSIPIQNIYYMLCYSWNQVEEGERVRLETIDSPKLVDLFAKVLIVGTNYLRKQGLDRGYVDYAEETSTIRGKINFTETIKQNLLVKAKAYCEFDRLSYNVLHNRLLKSSISYLVNVDDLDSELKHQLVNILCWFDDVDYIPPTRTNFHRVQLNRNNAFYGFLLNVCELIVENLLISEESGETHFQEFDRDEANMSLLFEKFVLNFYILEQGVFSKVKAEDIKWRGDGLDEKSKKSLPKMTTDVSLISPTRKIILDAKYYSKPLSLYHESEKVRSYNLYQLFSYIKNVEYTDNTSQFCEGILLYATVHDSFDFKYNLSGHLVRVCTINLNQDWRDIHNDLLKIIGVETN